MKATKRPIAVDLFCGCGGTTVGLKKAGFKVVAAVEINPLAADSYQLNHRGVFLWRKDIRLITGSEVLQKIKIQRGDLDLLAGCPPCQGFSTMRTLNGFKSIQDDRNDLIFDFLRFVEELQPKAIMLENVPGLATDNRLKEFRRALSNLKYESDYRIADAADYGVPQRRKRFILLAGRFGKINFAPIFEKKRSVRWAIGGLQKPEESVDCLHNYVERRSERVRDLIAKVPKNGGSRLDLPPEYQLDCHKKCDGFKDVYGRMNWDEVAPTITGGCINPSKGRFIHPEENRAITLREAALLQAFPPGYHLSLEQGRSNAAIMIGNALPPEFIRRHALEIQRYLKNIEQ